MCVDASFMFSAENNQVDVLLHVLAIFLKKIRIKIVDQHFFRKKFLGWHFYWVFFFTHSNTSQTFQNKTTVIFCCIHNYLWHLFNKKNWQKFHIN